MERLTHERVNGIKSGYWSAATKETLVQRLAAYEETGLTPEEIKDIIAVGGSDLAKMLRALIDNGETERMRNILTAEAEGRLVVLPCKVGDTVYFRTYAKSATVDLGIQPHKVVTYRLGMVIEGSYGVPETVLPDYEFGRTVFLTREEAEAALEGESNG